MSKILDECAGLGIALGSSSVCETVRSATRDCALSDHQSGAEMGADRHNEDLKPHLTVPSLRSMAAMQGLLLAEVGDAMVELDVTSGNGSGFREGPRIALESMTPGGGFNAKMMPNNPPEQSSLSRHGTLLTVGGAPERNAAELKFLLGNSSSRLKPGAAVLPPSGLARPLCAEPVVLEQAKPRARVEVDMTLESNVCVQGGYLKGHVKVHVRERSKKESPILLAEGKVRIVGFEFIPNGDDRYTFYHCSAPLSSIATSPSRLCFGDIDEEGFSKAREGTHHIPFAMHLPLEGGCNAKGVLHSPSGVKVRYIAMVSIKVKDADSDRRSIAHFYRNCDVWPRLDPSIVLAPASRPLQASISKSIFMGGSGKINLMAMLHRLYWVAGQQCNVKLSVRNDTKKTVKSVTLTLIRTTIVFKPHPHLDALPPRHGHVADPDACQTSTTQKEIAENTLEIGQQSSKGHASAKGWWTGVGCGEERVFSHFLLLPPDALSVTRGRLLEVEYTIRVSLSVGSFASVVQVILPVRIINFLSIDPPPSSPMPSTEDFTPRNSSYSRTTSERHHSRPTVVEGMFRPHGDGDQRILTSYDTSPHQSQHYDGTDDFSADGDRSSDFSDDDPYSDTDLYQDRNLDFSDTMISDLSLLDDSICLAISSAKMNHAFPTHFADLYHASRPKDDDTLAKVVSTNSIEGPGFTSPGPEPPLESTPRVQQADGVFANYNHADQTSNLIDTEGRPVQTRGPSSFALRVQEKLHTIAENRVVLPALAQGEAQPRFLPTLDGRDDMYARTEDSYSGIAEVSSDVRAGSLDCDMPSGPLSECLEGHEGRIPEVKTKEPLAASRPNLSVSSSITDFQIPISVSRLLSKLSVDINDGGDRKSNQGTLDSIGDVSCGVPLVTVNCGALTTAPGCLPEKSRLLPVPPLVDTAPPAVAKGVPASTAPLLETRGQSTTAKAQLPPVQLLVSAGGAPGKPPGSVKAKIKELEERAKALGDV